MEVSVIIPTHDPDPGRLRRVLVALREQTLDGRRWETVVVDNASSQFPGGDFFRDQGPPGIRVEHEAVLGLAAARARGFAAARGDLFVLVDDDNVLASDYLAQVVRLFGENPRLGAIGGVSAPEFERNPEPWQREFLGLLALRDLGAAPIISSGLRPPGAARNEYPLFAPIGAGMAIRRQAAATWHGVKDGRRPPDRRGGDLTSGGDNDIVLTLMKQGWDVAYFPELHLTHLIPAARLESGYLNRLNHAVQKSWMQVLTLHEANPWPPLSATGAALRKWNAWLKHRAWSSEPAHIRWRGACGHFEGRIAP